MYLTEEKLYEIIDDCESRDNYSPLIRILGEVYSDIASLSRSFLQNELNSPIDVMLDKAGGKNNKRLRLLIIIEIINKTTVTEILGEVTTLRKEYVRYLEGEKDKDEDSCVASPSGNQNKKKLPVDLASVRRAYSALFQLSSWIFENALVNALETLAGQLQINFLRRTEKYTDEDIVNVLLIAFEIPALGKQV